MRQKHRDTDRSTDRQADRNTDTQTRGHKGRGPGMRREIQKRGFADSNRKTDIHYTDRHTGIQRNTKKYKETDIHTRRPTKRQTHTDSRTD